MLIMILFLAWMEQIAIPSAIVKNIISHYYIQKKMKVWVYQKNRVIEYFSEYDNYFFIEDDVELLNPEVFDIHVSLAQKLNIQHL